MSSFGFSDLSPQELAALASTPALPPPPGIKPNFADPVGIQDPFIIVTSLFLALTGIFVLCRVYTKAVIARKASWDDCMHPAVSLV